MAQNNEDSGDLKPTPSLAAVPSSAGPQRTAQQTSFSAKIAELFLTAGHAFQKLGDLTVKLNAVNVDHEENRWTEKDIDNLRDAIARFAHELDNVSGSLLTRSKKMIRTDIKRRTLQMGMEPGGTTLAGARTILKPVSQVDPYLQQTASFSLTPSTSKTATPGPSHSVPSTSAAPSAVSSTSEAAPSTSNTESTSTPTSSSFSVAGSSSLPRAASKPAMIKKVYVQNSTTSMGAVRRPVQHIYRAPSGPSQSLRLVGGPHGQFGPPQARKVYVSAGSQLVRVTQSTADALGRAVQPAQRLMPQTRSRYPLSNGFVQEEVVYTSPATSASSSGGVAGPKRGLADSGPPAKAPKLVEAGAAES